MKKQKKKNGELFKKIWNVVKKENAHQQETADLKKALKANKPKGYLAKKIGVYSFWVILLVMFLLVFVIATNTGNTNATNSEYDEIKNSQAISDFGKQFLESYVPLQFSKELSGSSLESARQEKLKPYVTAEILTTLSKIYQDKHNIALKDLFVHDVQANGDTYLITYKVDTVATTNPFSKALVQADTDSTDIQNESIESTNYMTVKIFYMENEKRYVVYELPSFTAVEPIQQSVKVNEKTGLSSFIDMSAEKQITSFVHTFLDSYMRDTKDKLSYLVVPNYSLEGFNESLKLEKIEQVEIFKGAADSEYLVYVNALLSDKLTEMIYPTTYTLAIVESDGVYLIKAVNDKSYIQKALDYKLEVEMEKNK